MVKDGMIWDELYMWLLIMVGFVFVFGCIWVMFMYYGRGDEFRDVVFILIIVCVKMWIVEFVEEVFYVREVLNGVKFVLEVNYGYG